MSTRSLAARTTVAAAAAAVLSAGAADADLDPGREILRTGDRVPGLGQVGSFLAYPHGIDAAGRVLARGLLSDGGRAIVWTDGTRVETVWRHGEGGGSEGPAAGTAIASRDGTRVLALGSPPSPCCPSSWPTLFDLSGGVPRLLLGAGARTTDGTEILGFNQLAAASDAGAVLLSAVLASPGSDPQAEAIVLHDETGTRVVASTDSSTPQARRFQHVWGAGFAGSEVILSGCRDGDDLRCGIFREAGGRISPVLVAGDPGPNGTPIHDASAMAVASDGEILARVYATGNYDRAVIARSEHGHWIRVRDDNEPLADGRSLAVYTGRLNARGDVLLEGTADRAVPGTPPPTARAVLFHPAAGTPPLLFDAASDAALNDAGQIALRLAPPGAPASVVRWQDGSTRTLLSARSTAAKGAAFYAAGFRASCLADDGRVAVLADATNGRQAWLCADGSGIHLLATTTADGGGGVPYLTQCRFAGTEEIAVLADRAIMRLGTSPTTVLHAGDRLPNGELVEEIWNISANPSGTIAAHLRTAGGDAVVRQRRGGAVEVIDPRPPDGPPVAYLAGVGIADDDTVAALVLFETGAAALVVQRTGAARALRTFATGPAASYWLLVRGRHAVMESIDSDPPRLLRLDLSSGGEEELDWGDRSPAEGAYAFAIDLSAAGDVLFETESPLAADSPLDFWRWREGDVELLAHVESPNDAHVQPFALNDAGHLLLFAPGHRAGGRIRLARSGPPPSGACPGARTTSSGNGNGCEIGPRSPVGIWPLLPALLLWGAGVRARQRRPPALTHTV